MKRRMLTILLIVCLLLTTAGCAPAGLAQKMDAAEERMEHRMDVAEDAVEDAVQRAVTPAPAAIPEVPAAAPEVPPADRITPEQAQQIALAYVGVTADKAERLRAEFEVDDGVAQYDVEFLADNWEYEFEIDAANGNILSYDRDNRYD